MKRILTAVALTALVASPALAQTYSWRSPAMQSFAGTPSSIGIVDPVTGYPYVGPRTAVSHGMIVGADPDADVRSELRRSSPLVSSQ